MMNLNKNLLLAAFFLVSPITNAAPFLVEKNVNDTTAPIISYKVKLPGQAYKAITGKVVKCISKGNPGFDATIVEVKGDGLKIQCTVQDPEGLHKMALRYINSCFTHTDKKESSCRFPDGSIIYTHIAILDKSKEISQYLDKSSTGKVPTSFLAFQQIDSPVPCNKADNPLPTNGIFFGERLLACSADTNTALPKYYPSSAYLLITH